MTARAREADFSAFDSAERELEVDGCTIRFRHGGDPAAAHTLLYIHGGLANSAWWAHLLKAHSQDGTAWAALDLSGHGDSGNRTSYEPEQWAQEVLAVVGEIRRLGAIGVTLVGHSLGAAIALLVYDHCTEAPRLGIQSVIAVDGVPEGPNTPVRDRPGSVSRGVYGELEEAKAEFVGRQSRARWPSDLAAEVAYRSLIQTAGVWRWKHDSGTRKADRPRMAGTGRCNLDRTLLILGGDSPYKELIEGSEFLQSGGESLAKMYVAGAQHDVMMEQPVEFMRILKSWLPNK